MFLVLALLRTHTFCACSCVCLLQQRLRSELGYFLKLFCHCSAAAQHMIPCCLSDRQGAKVLHTFINTYTEIVADLHEIEDSETLRLKQTAQNIALPHYGGIAVSRTSGGYEPENSRKSQDSQNKCGLWHCYGSATWWRWKQGREVTKDRQMLVLPAAPQSQSHDGTEVTNKPMLDAGIAYPPSSSLDTFSRPVSLRSSMSPGQLCAADTSYGLGDCENITFGLEAGELGTQRQITEDAARREIESTERTRDSLYFIKINNPKSQSRNIRYVRREPGCGGILRNV